MTSPATRLKPTRARCSLITALSIGRRSPSRAYRVRERGYEADAVEKLDKRYKPARRFLAVETERLGQVPLTRILRERLDAELPEPLADVQEREREERVLGTRDAGGASVR
jgi:hypothetical protein